MLARLRRLLSLLRWPITGEVERRRPTPVEAEAELRQMTLAKRDQSR